MNKQTSKKHDLSTEEISRAFSAAQGKTVDLFVYGTLMNDRYVELLLNRKVSSISAQLYHYMRMEPSWSFPFIVQHRGAVTKGRVLQDISIEELKILDEFEDEGKMYYRKPVVVRTGKRRQRCQTYIGDIAVINSNISSDMQFEDRFSLYVEKKIDGIMADVQTNKPGLDRRVLHELMGSAVDTIIQSHFDGNYICGYIMRQALEEAAPPRLSEALKNKELLPYAGNYMRLACQHIVLNQFVSKIRHEHPEALRVSHQYFQHGIAILLAFLHYNKRKDSIERQFRKMKLHKIVDGRGYRDYAKHAIDIADIEYDSNEMEQLIEFINKNWYSTPTPLGAELEFSNLGAQAVYAKPGDDPVFDGFEWFWDFDMFQRTWTVGGHIDSHRQISIGQKRHRGFLEYAFGRYQILGDLSRPLFACPWAMSLLINEAVKFLDIAPHSLHISMELGGQHKHITKKPHKNNDLACLLLLGGDLRRSDDHKLREWRIFNNELDTNFHNAIHFSDRKYHFAKFNQPIEEASDVMEYKFMRLHKNEFDYETLIYALKGYQLHTHVRPINIREKGTPELPEQKFMRKWAKNPKPLKKIAIEDFVEKVKKGLMEEVGSKRTKPYMERILKKLRTTLIAKNNYLKEQLVI
jgi:gamma-glutamylcyclotransferase (GGCT)/AIG2-like uncharacterized protein YtfP